VRRLVEAGHKVTGMTRSSEKATWLEDVGASAVVCDARDREATMAAVRASEPEVVIDELTDLPKRPRGASNAKIRDALDWRPIYPDPREGFRTALG
jgi:hypothetical protein